jgi:hypothetical protein
VLVVQQDRTVKTDSLEKQEGIIVQKRQKEDRHQLLVIPNAKEEDISNKTVEELIVLAEKKDGAYYYVDSQEFNELDVGTQVIVYWNAPNQEDSAPPQRVAEKIESIPNQ